MDKRIKICQIITQTHFGGAQKYVCDISNSLSDDFDITIAFGNGKKQELEKNITNKSIKIIKFKYLIRKINPIKDKLAFWEMFFFFRKNKFDAIHLHSSKAGFLASISAKLAGIKKVIYTAHGWVFKEDSSKLKKWFYICLEKISAKFKNKIICVSQNDYDLALKYKICDKSKLEMIYNGFVQKNPMQKNIARQFVFERINKHDYDEIIIGTVSNLYKNKGIDILIKASQILNNKYSNLIFIVFGSGPEEQSLKSLVQELNLKNFYFLGIIEDSFNAYKYFRAFDIFTLSSRKEGLPYTLLEALNAQISIVCSNLDSITEIIKNNQNGLIFKSQDYVDLADKISLLIDDKELALGLIKNTNKILEKFNFETFINKIKKNYLL